MKFSCASLMCKVCLMPCKAKRRKFIFDLMDVKKKN